MNSKVKNYVYYLLIFIVSLVALVFFPMIGSEGDLMLSLPTTWGGWLLWITKNVLTAVLNVVIFYSFLQQGELNMKDDPKYMEANEILARVHSKEYRPMSPAK